jgi:hypothetical protein
VGLIAIPQEESGIVGDRQVATPLSQWSLLALRDRARFPNEGNN